MSLTVEDLLRQFGNLPKDTKLEYTFEFDNGTDYQDNGDCQSRCDANMLGTCNYCKKFYLQHIKLNPQQQKNKRKIVLV